MFTVGSAYRMIMETKRRRENFLEGRAEVSNAPQEEEGGGRSCGVLKFLQSCAFLLGD